MSAPMAGFGPMAWSPFPYGPIPSSGVISPFYVDLFNAQTVLGRKTWTVDPQASTAETITSFALSSQDTSSFFAIGNAVTSDFYSALLSATQSAALTVLTIQGRATSDTGTQPIVKFDARTTVGAASTRPFFSFRNADAAILDVIPLNSGANSALSWGSQTTGAPTFTTRSAGTRLVLRNEISGTRVDNAIGANGVGPWYSCSEATSSWAHRWYGGETLIGTLRGDGLMSVGAAITGSETLRVFATTNAAINVDVGSTNAVRLGVDASSIGYTGSTNATAFQVRTNGVSRVAFDTAGASAAFSVPVGVPSSTVATLPVATTAGRVVYVSDAAVAPCLAFANGTNWKRCDNAATTVV